MGWLFWKKQKEPDQLSQEINQIEVQTTAAEEKIAEMEQQLQKVARLQYKTGKTMEDKIDNLTTMVNENQTNATNTASQSHIVENLIRQIDDMDIVFNNLATDSQWSGLINKWTESLLLTLEDLGVTETIRKGEVFDPARSESVETVPIKHNQFRPYEITTIHKRGFAFNQGKVIRKAQVTTVKGGETQ